MTTKDVFLDLRTKSGLSQDELAELLNLENRASVSSYETNRRAVSGELAVELAKVLGSSVNYILRGEEEPENPIDKEIFRLVKSVDSDELKQVILQQVRAIADLSQKMKHTISV